MCALKRYIIYLLRYDTLLEQQKADWNRRVAMSLLSSRTTSLVICDREDVIESETNSYSTQMTLYIYMCTKLHVVIVQEKDKHPPSAPKTWICRLLDA
jgi:hypothetical protein